MTARRRDDSGQISVLLVGFLLVLGVLVAVVVDASAAYLHRQGLNSLADSAALAATDGVQGEQVYEGRLGELAQIDPVAAQAYAEQHLVAAGAYDRYPGLRVSITADGDTVTVRLAAPVELPLGVPGGPQRPVITGEAASVVVITD